ncbi:MAG: hypothetical protein HQ521_02560 [Bacteroidetes bacterium]|nr:hypothetical protein [Bacteroidota bacterium]
MSPKRKILISLVATAIFGYAIVVNEKDSSIPNNTSSLPQPKFIQLNNTYSPPHHLPSPQGTSTLNRDEVLKKSLKGYREQTYWGSEHPIDEKIRDFDDKEFNTFVEDEIKSNDVDVYWGAEY